MERKRNELADCKELLEQGFVPVHYLPTEKWNRLTIDQQEIVMIRFCSTAACKHGMEGRVRIFETKEHVLFFVK